MLFVDLPFVDRVEHACTTSASWSRSGTGRRRTSTHWSRPGASFSSMTGYIEGRPDRPGAESHGCSRRPSSRSTSRTGSVVRVSTCTARASTASASPSCPVDAVTGGCGCGRVDTLGRAGASWRSARASSSRWRTSTPRSTIPGTPFARAADTLALVQLRRQPRAADEPRPLPRTDRRGEPDRAGPRSLPWIGEIQVADVPGRCEPGTGEINYPAIARALDALGYRGVVGLEALGSLAVDDDLALTPRCRDAFTVDTGCKLHCLG